MVKRRQNDSRIGGGLRLSSFFIMGGVFVIRKVWSRFFVLVYCCFFMIFSNSILVFASAIDLSPPPIDYDGRWIRFISDSDTSGQYYYLGASCANNPNVYAYLLPNSSGTHYSAYLISDTELSERTRYGCRLMSEYLLKSIWTSKAGDGGYSLEETTGDYYVYYVSQFAPIDFGLSSHIDGNIPYFYVKSKVWENDGFVLGADPDGGSSSSIVYDSSIPAPANLRFESKSVGGFLGIGSKFEHKLSWSNGAATPPLYARISAVASTQATEDDVPFEDSTVSLLSAVKEGGYQADIGKYSVGTDELAAKILPGTSLNKVLEYRVQFYRYVDDVLQVGPVSTIHIKTNIFGKYDGYTVTTEYPKDPDNPGASGGTDDFYDNDWSSDGSHYDEYDKNGNLIDSGTSEDDGGPIAKLLKSLKSIPQLIGSFFDSVNQLFAGIGNFPALLSRLFAFLPAEIIALVGLGISVVIVLRILGR